MRVCFANPRQSRAYHVDKKISVDIWNQDWFLYA
jgi:hypothetical protein